jgi:hypothetical protein
MSAKAVKSAVRTDNSRAIDAMIKTERLDSLFALLQEMSASQPKVEKRKVSVWLQRIDRVAIFGTFILAMAAPLVLSVEHPSPPIVLIALLMCAGAVICCFAYALSALIQSFGPRHYHVLARLHADLHADTDHLGRLAAYDKATLQYALLQYRHHWDSVDSRVGMLIGDLRKLGVFPALAIYAMSASTLIKNESSYWLWLPLGVTTLLYSFQLFAHSGRERPQQVAELLRHAIEQATPSPATAVVNQVATSTVVDTTKIAPAAASPGPPSTTATRPAASLPATPLPSTA